MPAKILIVEDEMLIALEVEALLADVGHEVVGIAPDLPTALHLADQPIDVALVDLNLRDGLTGPEIAKRLAEREGTVVLFVTANPRILGNGVPGAVGVLTKPVDEQTVRAAVDYALHVRRGEHGLKPPAALTMFRRAA